MIGWSLTRLLRGDSGLHTGRFWFVCSTVQLGTVPMEGNTMSKEDVSELEGVTSRAVRRVGALVAQYETDSDRGEPLDTVVQDLIADLLLYLDQVDVEWLDDESWTAVEILDGALAHYVAETARVDPEDRNVCPVCGSWNPASARCQNVACEPICDGCGEPITGDDYVDRHHGHESDCPQEVLGTCQCDLNWHAACCSDCDVEGGV